MIGPAVAALVQAENSKVDLSLMIFDLGGITEHSGSQRVPRLRVHDPVAVNHRCYDPKQWDSYSDLGEAAVSARLRSASTNWSTSGDVSVTSLWLRAIAAHPIAYAEHRLTISTVSTWFLVPSGPDFTAWSRSVPNPWGFRVGRDSCS